MAFTGEKRKGSKILTPETVENSSKFYELLDEIKACEPEQDERLRSMMFEKMFHHLSHSAQKEMLDWAERASWKVCVMNEEI